jgi:hypothetical protein
VALLQSWLKNKPVFNDWHSASMSGETAQSRISGLAITSERKTMFSQSHAKSKRFINAALLTLAAYATITYAADVVILNGNFSAAPDTASLGTGTVEATLDTQSNELRWKVVYSGLTGPAGAAHFHGPAEAGQDAGVVLGFKGSVESPITGAATIAPEQAIELLNGKWYVNIHTKAHPGGEIRAQLVPAN